MKCNASALLSFGACLLMLSAPACVRRSSPTPTTAPEDSEFRAFLAEYDEAIRQFAQGNPAKVKTLWSHSPDVSLIGGFGGRRGSWLGRSKCQARLGQLNIKKAQLQWTRS